MSRTSSTLAGLLALLALCEALSATGIAPAPHEALGSVGFAVALAAAFVLLAAHAARRAAWFEPAAAIAIGALLEGGHLLAGAHGRAQVPLHLLAGLGWGSLLVALGTALRARPGADRARALEALGRVALLPLLAACAGFLGELTAALHPRTLDPGGLMADRSLGGEPAFVLARALSGMGWPLRLSEAASTASLLLVALVAAAGRPRLLLATVVATLSALVLHHIAPASGPLAFDGFPALPAPATLAAGDFLAPPALRTAFPSLPLLLCLLAAGATRGLGPAVRALAAGWVALVALDTVAGGTHYVATLPVTVSLAVLIQALLTSVPTRAPLRRATAFVAAAALLLWLVLLHRHAPFAPPPVALALLVASLAGPLLLERRLARAARSFAAAAAPPDPRVRLDRTTLTAAVLFVLSGFAGLLYEVVFAKQLALTFGSTATASTTVLATYMGGMALGAWLGGGLASRRSDPLRVYALCEGGIGILCALSPLGFAAVRALYVAVAAGGEPGRAILVVFQVLLGGAVLLPPTILMGITMPVLARHFAERDRSLGRAVGLLYGANTFGAALGSLATGYFILPGLGVLRTTLLAVAANLTVAFLGMRLARGESALASVPLPHPPGDPAGDAAGDPAGDDDSDPHSAAPGAPAPDPHRQGPAGGRDVTPGAHRRLARLGFLLLGAGGLVTLALEVTYVHLLAVVAGNSAYAFSLMLFTFLLGLGGGSALARGWLARLRPEALPAALAAVEIALAVTLLAGVHAWQALPGYFASFQSYPLSRGFGARELVRFLVCTLAMAPPAVCIGALWPLAMECVGRGARDRLLAMGRASALNTAGNIAGALIGGFVLLPLAASLRSLHLLAASALLLALVAAAFASRGRAAVIAAVAAAAALFALQPAELDYTRLATGANVYFRSQGYGEVIDHAESLDGGLTTVARSVDRDGRPVLTLLTNGKFQGDDSPLREVRAQLSFAMVPLLHTARRGRALVIGVGTGVSARAIRDAAFDEVDLVELSADIVELARRYFGPVNGDVLASPRVRLHVTDGRNYLLLTDRRYDLISMEVSSIWFAGAAALYNREFYRLARLRLGEGGVLQQWVQLHHISPEDIVSVLATVRTVFSAVWLYYGGTQGVIVACDGDCRPSPETLARLDGTRTLAGAFELLGGSARDLLQGRILTPDGVDLLLQAAREKGLDVGALVADDDNLHLEYSTPRGNVRDYARSLQANLDLLRTFRPASPLEGTRLAPGGL